MSVGFLSIFLSPFSFVVCCDEADTLAAKPGPTIEDGPPSNCSADFGGAAAGRTSRCGSVSVSTHGLSLPSEPNGYKGQSVGIGASIGAPSGPQLVSVSFSQGLVSTGTSAPSLISLAYGGYGGLVPALGAAPSARAALLATRPIASISGRNGLLHVSLGRVGVGGLGRGRNPLASFFPFDPFRLRRSHRFIGPLYAEWRGLGEDHEEEVAWDELLDEEVGYFIAYALLP